MKICFTSDHHHHPFRAFAKSQDGYNSRLLEGIRVELGVQKVMKARGVTLHIRCGDLFDQKHTVDALTALLVQDRIRENVEELGISEYILGGNHDVTAIPGTYTVSFLRSRKVWIAHKVTTLWIGGGTALTFLPHFDEPDLSTVRRPAVSGHNLLIGHLGVFGARNGSEFVLPSYVSLHDTFDVDAWDQIILGHVHHAQDLVPGKVRYVGPLCHRSFSDEGAECRALVYDTVTREMESVPLPGPRFQTVYVDTGEELDTFTPMGNTYYRFLVRHPKITAKDIDPKADGAAGWVITDDLSRTTTRPRLSLGAKPWTGVCEDYLQQTKSPLDHAALLRAADECIHATGSVS